MRTDAPINQLNRAHLCFNVIAKNSFCSTGAMCSEKMYLINSPQIRVVMILHYCVNLWGVKFVFGKISNWKGGGVPMFVNWSIVRQFLTSSKQVYARTSV